MDKLHESHLIVQWINMILGPMVESMRLAMGFAPTTAAYSPTSLTT